MARDLPAKALTTVALVGVSLLAAPTYALAQDSSPLALSEPSGADDNELRAVIAIMVLLSMAAGLLLLELRRRRRKSPALVPQRAHPPAMAGASSTSYGDPILEAQTAHPTLSTGELEIAAVSATKPGIIAGLVSESEQADANDLFTDVRPARVADTLDTSTTHMSCTECARSFDVGTRFCPYDGELLLMTEEIPTTDQRKTDMVCPECASTFEHGAIYCPHDRARLVAEPAEEGQPTLLGAAPLAVCVECTRELPVSQRSCPDCGPAVQVKFLHGRTTRGLWVASSDPTRICPDCGTRYSEELDFCSKDGTDLVRLN